MARRFGQPAAGRAPFKAPWRPAPRRLVITGARQDGAEVVVSARFEDEPEGAQTERARAQGILRGWTPGEVWIEDYSETGCPERWYPQGDRIAPEPDLYESFSLGDAVARGHILYLVIVIVAAFLAGAL